MYKELFSPIVINGHTVKNRFARSAQKDSLCGPEGEIPDDVYKLYDNLAKGGVGMIITGAARVRYYERTQYSGLFRVGNPDLLSAYKKLAEICHQNGTTAIMQLTYSNHDSTSRDTADVDQLLQDFIHGAEYAQEAGFDGIQLHEAHSTFLSGLLNPLNNRRTDKYADRDLFGVEVVKGIRQTVNKDFIVMTKINCSDFEEGGMTVEESLRHLKLEEAVGLDAVEISGANPCRKVRKGEKGSYFSEEAAYIKRNLSMPVLLVGGNRNIAHMAEIHQQNGIDMFSLARPLNSEPDLINQWQSGICDDGKCISCNMCLRTYCLGCILNGAKVVKPAK